MTRPVLVVDDDESFLELLEFELADQDVELQRTRSAAEAREALHRRRFAAALLDLGLPDANGEELLASLRQQHPQMPCVVLTARDDVEQVVRCIQHGAVDYLTKPFDRMRLLTSLNNAITQGALRVRVGELRHAGALGSGFARFLGESRAVHEARALLRRAAASDVTLLLLGESGTGKEVAARAVHEESRRAAGPFVAVNCGALPDGVIESELFGHEKGAFTGAVAARRGCFESAEGGTIFLDEIGELRPDLQVRLLRVLQEREIQRVGAEHRTAVDVRVIAATHRRLREALDADPPGFRDDLYYRLAVFPVELPPLRERDDDVLVLAQSFLQRFAARHRKAVERMSSGFLAAIARHDWPGNVRELENVIERAVILEDDEQLDVHDLPVELRPVGVDRCQAPTVHASWDADDGRGRVGSGVVATRACSTPLLESASDDLPVRPFDEEERRIVLNALRAADWNIKAAADLLGLGRATIYRKIERYGLSR